MLYVTNDGSIGLYSEEYDDIYHSVEGALSEAYEKFILPADFKNFFKINTEIKILDLCFGIGYNTKSFINNFIENIYSETIGSNNVKSNYKIHTDNIRPKIIIHAIDIDKKLSLLSPFFVIRKFIRNKNLLIYKNSKYKKFFNRNIRSKYELKKETNIILLNLISKYLNDEILDIISDKMYAEFLDKSLVDLWLFYKSDGYNYTLFKRLKHFLHNIYYRYISISNKNALKYLKMIDFDFLLDNDDARQVLKNNINKYNFVFLDAFTPTKCPCLWTVDFFKELYNHLELNGMVLTYSTSAIVRNAFINAGFCVGKIFNKNKFCGTVAFKSKNFSDTKYITHLSEFDLGLLKTKAGIFYRDKNLNLSNEAIIAAREKDVKNSELISSSQYLKNLERTYEKV